MELRLSSHAEEEMSDDNPERRDVENAILKGWTDKAISKYDLTRYP